jgi:hypothetical protein
MTDVGAEVVQEPGGRIKSSKASGKAPVKGNAKAQAQAAIGATLASLKPNTTLQSFASATGDPLPADVLAETAATPNVTANLHIGDGSNVLGLVALGGLYPNIAIASGISATSSSSAAFEIDTTGFEGSTLRIGLLEGLATGFGFDSLLFRIIENGTMVEEEMFTSLESALSFFDDNVLDLGPGMAGPSGFLELQFDLDVIAHRSGDGFSVNLVAAVPEPGMLTLLSIGVLALDWYRRAKRSPP